jgi:HEAT repeat protein
VTRLLPITYNELTDPDTEICTSIVKTLGTLGVRSVAHDLLDLLADGRFASSVNERIADTLGTLDVGDESIAYGLLRLLSDSGASMKGEVREHIVMTLGELARNQSTAQIFDEAYIDALVKLLTSEYANSVHSALWTMCEQAGVRVYMRDGSSGHEFMLVKWGIECGKADL